MASKIFKSIFITVMAVMLAAFAVIVGFSYSYYEDDTQKSLHRECEHMKAGFDAWGVDFFASVSEGGPRVALISPSGDVLYDSEPSSQLENQGECAEVRDALIFGFGSSERRSESSVKTFYYAMRTSDGNIVRVSEPYDKIWNILSEVIVPVVLLFSASSLAAFAVSRIVASKIVQPINEINLDSPDENKIYPELRPMAEKIRIQNYSISRQLSELKMRENEFQLLTHNMSEGMILINARAGVLSINRSAKRIFGVTGEIPKTILGVRSTEEFKSAVSNAMSGENRL